MQLLTKDNALLLGIHSILFAIISKLLCLINFKDMFILIYVYIRSRLNPQLIIFFPVLTY